MTEPSTLMQALADDLAVARARIQKLEAENRDLRRRLTSQPDLTPEPHDMPPSDIHG